MDSPKPNPLPISLVVKKGTGKGKGLGLSIAYQIVKDYGGDIEVQSEEDGGTTFTLTFPFGL